MNTVIPKRKRGRPIGPDWDGSPELRIPHYNFVQQRTNARIRGIPFELTFYQWWDTWQKSGHWEERGCKSGQYVMARYGDSGPYAVGNVKIVTCNENSQEMWTDDFRARISDLVKASGHLWTEESRAKVRVSRRGMGFAKGNPGSKFFSAESRAKIAAANSKRVWSEESRAKVSKRCSHRITINDVTKTAVEWARQATITPEAFLYRLKRGWASQELVLPPYSKRASKRPTRAHP